MISVLVILFFLSFTRAAVCPWLDHFLTAHTKLKPQHRQLSQQFKVLFNALQLPSNAPLFERLRLEALQCGRKLEAALMFRNDFCPTTFTTLLLNSLEFIKKQDSLVTNTDLKSDVIKDKSCPTFLSAVEMEVTHYRQFYTATIIAANFGASVVDFDWLRRRTGHLMNTILFLIDNTSDQDSPILERLFQFMASVREMQIAVEQRAAQDQYCVCCEVLGRDVGRRQFLGREMVQLRNPVYLAESYETVPLTVYHWPLTLMAKLAQASDTVDAKIILTSTTKLDSPVDHIGPINKPKSFSVCLNRQEMMLGAFLTPLVMSTSDYRILLIEFTFDYKERSVIELFNHLHQIDVEFIRGAGSLLTAHIVNEIMQQSVLEFPRVLVSILSSFGESISRKFNTLRGRLYGSNVIAFQHVRYKLLLLMYKRELFPVFDPLEWPMIKNEPYQAQLYAIAFHGMHHQKGMVGAEECYVGWLELLKVHDQLDRLSVSSFLQNLFLETNSTGV